ncbi:alpha/beta hydrolase family protein [Sunxiuqinia sp. sy24]|uniref:alpha/beta hydrolase family protein n=1 Tax=Sunxiuqinia sp. sy24 TaxID=3461495 RepID=UPI004045548D
MNRKYHHRLIVLFLAVFIISCGKNDDPAPSETSFAFLESEKQVNTISQTSAQLLFSVLAAQFDDDGTMDNEVSSGAVVHKVTYNSTFEGEPLLVSGLISVPDKPGNYPVISFQNGTNVEYSKAPTVDRSNELFLVLKNFASLGFIVVIPDYPGFGESTQVFHPYLEKDDTLPSLVDLLKATREFVSQDHITASLNEDLYLMGYSQGGWSTMQLKHEIEQNGLEDYQLKASSCGAGPYNLNRLNELLVGQDSYPMPYFLAYLMQAYHVHGKYSNPLNEIFANEYAAKIPDLFNGVTTGGEINDELNTQVEDLFQADFRTGFATNAKYQSLQTALTNSSIDAWQTTSPTRLFHGENDTYVPLELSVEMHQDFKALNVNDELVKLIIMPDADHQSGILPFGIASINWFLDLKNK